jgi:hypothetical protein
MTPALLADGSFILRNEHLFLMCTKAPYGLEGVLDVNLDQGQEENSREPPTLRGRVEEEPAKQTLQSG